MSSRNTIVRSLHDLGAAAWFGGALMGAVGVNGAAASVAEPTDRAKVAAMGWAMWIPVSAAAIGAHLIGGAGILLANRGRARHQAGVRANTITKLVVTAAALATTAYSGAIGAKVAEADSLDVDGVTEPSPGTPADQNQLKMLQWVTPVLTGIIVVLGAQQGEQQRPTQVLTGVRKKLASR